MNKVDTLGLDCKLGTNFMPSRRIFLRVIWTALLGAFLGCSGSVTVKLHTAHTFFIGVEKEGANFKIAHAVGIYPDRYEEFFDSPEESKASLSLQKGLMTEAELLWSHFALLFASKFTPTVMFWDAVVNLDRRADTLVKKAGKKVSPQFATFLHHYRTPRSTIYAKLVDTPKEQAKVKLRVKLDACLPGQGGSFLGLAGMLFALPKVLQRHYQLQQDPAKMANRFDTADSVHHFPPSDYLKVGEALSQAPLFATGPPEIHLKLALALWRHSKVPLFRLQGVCKAFEALLDPSTMICSAEFDKGDIEALLQEIAPVYWNIHAKEMMLYSKGGDKTTKSDAQDKSKSCCLDLLGAIALGLHPFSTFSKLSRVTAMLAVAPALPTFKARLNRFLLPRFSPTSARLALPGVFLEKYLAEGSRPKKTTLLISKLMKLSVDPNTHSLGSAGLRVLRDFCLKSGNKSQRNLLDGIIKIAAPKSQDQGQ